MHRTTSSAGIVGGLIVAVAGGWWVGGAERGPRTQPGPRQGAASAGAALPRIAAAAAEVAAETEPSPPDEAAQAAAPPSPDDPTAPAPNDAAPPTQEPNAPRLITLSGAFTSQLELAQELLEAGRFEEALHSLERLLMLDPSNGSVYLLRAQVHSALGRHMQAEADLRRANEIGVTEVEALQLVEGVLEGRVVDAWGQPVADAELLVEDTGVVHALFESAESEAGTLAPPPRTAADGSFRVAVAALQDTIWVSARAKGHAPSELVSVSLTAAAPFEIALPREARLEVTVRDASTGAPIEGAEVQLGATTASSDASGRAAIGSLPDGLHGVSVSAQGYASWSRDHVPASANALNRIDVALTAGISLSGVVYTTSGEPASGALVTLGGSQTGTDSEGRYAFHDVLAGNYGFTVSDANSGFATRVDLHQAQTLDLTLQPLAELRISLQRGGRPTRAKISVERFGSRVTLLYPSSEGGSSRERLIPGPIELVLAEPNVHGRRSLELLPGGSYDVDWQLPETSVEAQLFEPGGEPASGAWLVLYQAGQQVAAAVADASGHVEVGGVEPGLYEVYVRHRKAKGVTHRPGVALPASLEITIPRGGRLEAQLLDPSGAPLGALPLVVRGVQHPVGRPATTNEQGRFTADELYAGRYTVEVDAARLELEALRRGFDSLELGTIEFDAVAGETQRLTLRAR